MDGGYSMRQFAQLAGFSFVFLLFYMILLGELHPEHNRPTHSPYCLLVWQNLDTNTTVCLLFLSDLL